MFILFFICALFYSFRPRITKVRNGMFDDNQLSCVKNCMEGTRGRMTVEKRFRCGQYCKTRLGLPSESENDDTNAI
ncbi:hypothetical protein TVAG_170340 [Trichomonas vaginalis G3]|uniref:Uncharacterized protein n=1 Tax=Trichomonas vaginalis (strain ATCC PRA-98 / G3) TaxID=412133 RepID=A2DPH6_TRIV3|nr:hypothetical protein TVAGG3_0680520 [Trichomonas vaginalis G3]EAY17720.1 hypothetical protein TVAG_170340 [Trichomonas vaginalis G3]KAI5507876.1 hypothetical protein TVAGG3_0680520 [Trichomonas vaginalis G3]|eukprot:XP_001329855.1 hypothetical protein [Trichomonas vaginalis G3]